MAARTVTAARTASRRAAGRAGPAWRPESCRVPAATAAGPRPRIGVWSVTPAWVLEPSPGPERRRRPSPSPQGRPGPITSRLPRRLPGHLPARDPGPTARRPPSRPGRHPRECGRGRRPSRCPPSPPGPPSDPLTRNRRGPGRRPGPRPRRGRGGRSCGGERRRRARAPPPSTAAASHGPTCCPAAAPTSGSGATNIVFLPIRTNSHRPNRSGNGLFVNLAQIDGVRRSECERAEAKERVAEG